MSSVGVIVPVIVRSRSQHREKSWRRADTKKKKINKINKTHSKLKMSFLWHGVVVSTLGSQSRGLKLDSNPGLDV